MTESQGNSAIDQKKKGASKLVSAFAIFIIFLGLTLLTDTLIGGVLVLVAGCIILPKIRVIAIASGLGGSLNNQRNLKIIAALFLIVGLILSSTAITNKNLNEWNKNKQDVLSKLEANIQTNNLEEAKKMIDQYELIVKNDPEFDAVVGKYKAAKEKLVAQEPVKVSNESLKTNNSTSQENPADVDMFCSGVLIRLSGIIDKKIHNYGGDALVTMQQLSAHYDNNGNLLMQRAILKNAKAESANMGMNFANQIVGENIDVLFQKGSEPNKVVMGCLQRMNG